MPYATQADLVRRFGDEELIQLTDRLQVGQIAEVVVTAALSDAAGTIDSYIGARYAVPVSPVPELLLRLTCDIARFLLRGETASDAIRKVYDDALKTLRDLSEGRAVLVGAAPAPPGGAPAIGSGTARVSALCRRLDRPSLSDYLG